MISSIFHHNYIKYEFFGKIHISTIRNIREIIFVLNHVNKIKDNCRENFGAYKKFDVNNLNMDSHRPFLVFMFSFIWIKYDVNHSETSPS